jgi:hypothetical protein
VKDRVSVFHELSGHDNVAVVYIFRNNAIMGNTIGPISGLLLLMITSFGAPAQTNAAQQKEEHLTGVCYRRLTGIDNKGTTNKWYEFILVKSSGNLNRDIVRMRIWKKSPSTLNPDLIENEWFNAWLGDHSFDGIRGPDCSSLPKIGKARAPH